MFCTRCGCELVGGARFCHKCGCQVEETQQKQQVAHIDRKHVKDELDNFLDEVCEMRKATENKSREELKHTAIGRQPNIVSSINAKLVSPNYIDLYKRACRELQD